MLNPPLPGTPLLTRSDGWVAEATWLLQVMNGVKSPWTHVALMVDNDEVFEMAYHGGHVISWREWHQHRPVIPVPVNITDDQRFDICAEARKRVGTAYNWDCWFYLAAARMRLPLAKRLMNRMAGNGKMICSQAIVDIYSAACGIQLFDDKRLMYDVTPGHFVELLK